MWYCSSSDDIPPEGNHTDNEQKGTDECKYKFFLHGLLLREESIECILIFSPVLIYLDPESEEYLLAEDILQDDARRCSDILDLLPSLADEDRLL